MNFLRFLLIGNLVGMLFGSACGHSATPGLGPIDGPSSVASDGGIPEGLPVADTAPTVVLHSLPGLSPRSETQPCVTADVLPEKISATGCYTDLIGKTVSADLVPYDVMSPLWTDGAIKMRYLSVPPGKFVTFDAAGAWEFPVGSVLLKEFRLRMNAGDPTSDTLVETRVMLKREQGWLFGGYKWNPLGTDAELVKQTHFVPFALQTPTPSAPLQYGYPAERECNTCHTSTIVNAFGPSTIQLAGIVSYDGKPKDQIDALAEIGLFVGARPQAPERPLVDPLDTSKPLEARARSWLHANCSHCHQPGGWSSPGMTMDLRFTTDLGKAEICNVETQYIVQIPRIKAGDARGSAIWRRITSPNIDRMPPIGTSTVDPAVEVVRQWIDGITACPPRVNRDPYALSP
ncbi:MAG: hypothetical protein SGI86_10315 [Deltaproteobacteria bacterium]|nr:hypothetical protein [Deltaproteobacteria bacterium]